MLFEAPFPQRISSQPLPDSRQTLLVHLNQCDTVGLEVRTRPVVRLFSMDSQEIECYVLKHIDLWLSGTGQKPQEAQRGLESSHLKIVLMYYNLLEEIVYEQVQNLTRPSWCTKTNFTSFVFLCYLFQWDQPCILLHVSLKSFRNLMKIYLFKMLVHIVFLSNSDPSENTHV